MTYERAQALTDAQKRKIVIGVLTAMFLATLDQAIVAPAVPAIGALLGDPEYLPWIIAAYMLAATAATPLYGKLADLRGRRPVFFTAIGVFTAGSIICALAPTMLTLILGRAVQGLGGGGLIALTQTIIADVVSPRERGRYVAYISTVWLTSSVAGPVLGGAIAQYLHWSMIFWINLPLATIAFFMASAAMRLVPDIRQHRRLDIPGAVLTVGATSTLMAALTLGSGSRHEWSSPLVLGLAGCAIVLTLAAIWRLLTAAEPLIPLSVLRNPIVRAATLCNASASAASIGMSVYLPIYLILVVGLEPAGAGAALVAMLGGSVLGANTAGRYMSRVTHYRRAGVAGLCLSFAAAVAVALQAGSTDFPRLEALIFLLGLGTGPQFPITTVSVQNAVDAGDIGVATATLAFMRSLGGAAGVAVLGAILLAHGLERGLEGDLGAIARDPRSAGLATDGFRVLFATAAAGHALALISLLSMKELPLRTTAPAETRARAADMPDQHG